MWRPLMRRIHFILISVNSGLAANITYKPQSPRILSNRPRRDNPNTFVITMGKLLLGMLIANLALIAVWSTHLT